MTSATTSPYTIYSPFTGYTFDDRGSNGQGGNITAGDQSGLATTQLTLNGIPVAEYVAPIGADGTVATGTLTYVHTNYLGTPVLQTNGVGDVTSIFITDVWGNTVIRDTRTDAAWNNDGYTNHRFDETTGLTYANARYLEPGTHRFLSVDPIQRYLSTEEVAPLLYDPQQLNPYSYARNSPGINTDPTGQASLSQIYTAISGLLSRISSFISSGGLSNTSQSQRNSIQNSLGSLAGQLGVPISDGGRSTMKPWQGQSGAMDCYTTSIKMAGYSPATGINVEEYNESGILEQTPYAKKGFKILNDLLSENKGVIVGINSPKFKYQNVENRAVGHFVVIKNAGVDMKGIYYHFYDPGTGFSAKGANPENKFYLNTNNFSLTGTSHLDGNPAYTVAEIKY